MNLSIFVLYSPDRSSQLKNTIGCLEDMDGFGKCQKILCVDGICNVNTDFEVIEVKSCGRYYCWACALNAGISASKYDIFLYLDSDRILPKDYLLNIKKQMSFKKVLYSEKLYALDKPLSLQELRKVRNTKIGYKERRMKKPEAEYGKNPMSGNITMFKKDYLESGGMDHRYQGWGFPDIDYFMTTTNLGYTFEKVPGIELHQYHEYNVEKSMFRLMNLWNALQFCRKWGLKPGKSIQERMQEVKYNPQIDTFDQFVQYQKILFV